MQVKCPKCGVRKEYRGNEYRPFCSRRCKLLDFGAWTEGDYSLPVESTSLSEEELNTIEAIIKSNSEKL